MPFPRMLRIAQSFEAPRIDGVPDEVERQLASLNLGDTIQPGQTVAITAGSRGIANIAEIIKATATHFKNLGAAPFIVPAMGSHGGGTAQGQREIIESYGITEEFTGAEIRASMETVIVDTTAQGIPVHFDKHAYEADHVLVCGRVKPHTGFVGEIESGLHKMMLIGLGKHNGAKIYHRAIKDFSWLEIVTAALASGLDGIANKIEPPDVHQGDVYAATDLPQVPRSLVEATDTFGQSEFVKQALGEDVVEHYVHFFRTEQQAYDKAVTDWERRRYFERI